MSDEQHDTSLDGVRQVAVAEFWDALSSELRPAADGFYIHEDELNDVLRHFGLIAPDAHFRLGVVS